MLTTDQGTTLLLVAKYGPIHPNALARETGWPYPMAQRRLTALLAAGLIEDSPRGYSLSTEGHRLVTNDREAVGLPEGA